MSGQFDLGSLLGQFAGQQATLATLPPPAGMAPAPSNPFAATPAPAAPAPQGRPSFWIPGDPMNERQTQAHSMGLPLSMVAALAPNAPPDDVGKLYDQKPAPTVGINPREAAAVVPSANPAQLAAQQALVPTAAPAEEAPKAKRGRKPKTDGAADTDDDAFADLVADKVIAKLRALFK
jgi:hypothetical protein